MTQSDRPDNIFCCQRLPAGTMACHSIAVMETKKQKPTATNPEPDTEDQKQGSPGGEIEDQKKVDPTRYGDWEKKGRCIDF